RRLMRAVPARSAAERTAVPESLRALERWGDSRGWIGSDPYDGLNARRFDGLLRRTPFGRRVLTQVVRRSPLDLRRVLGIAPGRSAAALASVASAYALGDDVEKLRRTLALLDELRCTD